MSGFRSDYCPCSKALQDRVYRVANDANLPDDLRSNIMRAGQRILTSRIAQSNRKRITADELVDLLERLYAKTGTQFTPIITRLAHGALSIPEERLREWYATARQIANSYTTITPEQQKEIGNALAVSDDPDGLRNKILAYHQEELKTVLETHPLQIATRRNGRPSQCMAKTKSTWRTGKEKQL